MDIFEVPWLKSCHVPTGQKWGKRIADVVVKGVPRNMICQYLLKDNDELLLVFYRWDMQAEEGWSRFYDITVGLPDGRELPVRLPPSSQLVDGHSIAVPIVCRERPRQEGRAIPRRIYNLCPPIETRPKKVRKSLENTRELNDVIQCTADYFVIGDEECQKEIEASEIEGLAEAYNTLVPGSYKADLMRYYLLWKYGGIYYDDKSILRHCIDSPVFDSFMIDKENKACDFFISTLILGIPEIAFIGARPGSPIMRKTIDMVIENVRNREYGENSLAVTGNFLLRKIFEGSSFGFGYSDVIWRRYLEEVVANLKMLNSFEDIQVNGELLWHRSAITNFEWPKSDKYYGRLWRDRGVYTDGNPPIPWSRQLGPFIATAIGILLIGGFFYLLAKITALPLS